MGLGNILGDKVAATLSHRVLLADDLDATAARGTCWLEDKHVFVVVHLAIINESLVILRKDVGLRTDVELLAMLSALLLDVSPEVGLRA